MLSKLKTLKDEIVKYGVCQYDVQTLEKEYDVSILEDNYNINQFTKIKTDILKDIVLKKIDSRINELQKEKDSINLNYIISSIDLYKEYSDNLKKLKDTYPIDEDKIDDSLNGYLLKYYDEEGNIKNAQDLSIRAIFKNNIDILKSINDDNSIDSFVDKYLKEYGHMNIFTNFRQALIFLKNNNISHNYIAIENIKNDIATKISKNELNIDKLLEMYNNTIFSTEKNSARLIILNILYRIYQK